MNAQKPMVASSNFSRIYQDFKWLLENLLYIWCVV